MYSRSVSTPEHRIKDSASLIMMCAGRGVAGGWARRQWGQGSSQGPDEGRWPTFRQLLNGSPGLRADSPSSMRHHPPSRCFSRCLFIPVLIVWSVQVADTCCPISMLLDFLRGSVVKNPPANAGDFGSVPGRRRSPGDGNCN